MKIAKLLSALLLLILLGTLPAASCKKSGSSGTDTIPVVPPGNPDVASWITKADRSQLLQSQTTVLSFGQVASSLPDIVVDSTTAYQSIDGFGYTLTGGSAYLINQMPAAARTALLTELFGTGTGSIGISYLRIPVGACDMDATVFSYDDLPLGQTDTSLLQFSLAQDSVDLVPLLQQILAIRPALKILASPWSPPVWMKDNGNSVNGSLQPKYYAAYARYFVKYIQLMQAKGIPIDALTIQNEPLNGGNNPSMVMTALQQAEFIKTNLGPAFQAAGITTKIITYDHNCDHPDYPLTVLGDAAARPFVYGSAFHLYAGDISALTSVHDYYPDKQLYFTEQYTASTGDFGGDLKWHLKNVIIGSMRNWSRTALEWNLANDASFGPHTIGGCTTCKGAVTLGASITRNVGYYIVAHAAAFVPPGSVRIASSMSGDLSNVAFLTPTGKKVLIVLNEGAGTEGFNIRFKGKWTTTQLDAGAVGTYVW